MGVKVVMGMEGQDKAMGGDGRGKTQDSRESDGWPFIQLLRITGKQKMYAEMGKSGNSGNSGHRRDRKVIPLSERLAACLASVPLQVSRHC